MTTRNYIVEVENIRGHCRRGYRKGDQFTFRGFDTPDGFCGGAYTVLYPVLCTLCYGGRFQFENDPNCRTGIGCPENGTVVFKVRLME